MKRSVSIVLLCCWVLVAHAQSKEPLVAFSFTFSPVQTKAPFSQTLFSSDSVQVTTIDSITASPLGFEAMFASPKWLFLIGSQVPSTWIGERPYRLRYTTLAQNQIITTTDSIQAEFRNASFFVGFGYRFQVDNPNFDISLVPYWQKQTGRFIIQDSLYSVYKEQLQLSSDVRNNLPDPIRVELNELTQERTRDFSIGLRVNFSYGMTYNGAGLIFFFSPRIQYSYLTVKEELYTRARSRTSNGLSYGGLVGIGLLISDMPVGKK